MKPHKPAKCDVCSTPSFERNNYFYGKQFTVRDLLQEQDYFNEKRHLINRMVLGWGVVCGLDVEWDHKRCEFIVGKGMALDCCGREIVICEAQFVPFKDYDDQCGYARDNKDYKATFVLCLEYDDCFAEPVDLPPIGCDEKEHTEFNRVRDGYKLSIKEWKEPEASDPFTCLAHNREGQYQTSKCETETLHHYLCRTRMKHCVECEGECIVLATITVTAEKGGQHASPKDYPQQKGGYPQQQGGYPQQPQGGYPVKVDYDQCTYRRFVYSNSLLYDLIYCHHGDLPHIVDFNWRTQIGPKRELDWDAFVQLVKGGLTVYFDREMVPASLNRHTFFISFFHEDPDSGNIFVKRIPAKEIRSGFHEDCYTTTWLPDPDWFADELEAQKSQLRGGVDIEITLRGSRIWDSRGKGLDGAFLADKLPTGNGTQGTEFIDWFRVLPRDGKKKTESYNDY